MVPRGTDIVQAVGSREFGSSGVRLADPPDVRRPLAGTRLQARLQVGAPGAYASGLCPSGHGNSGFSRAPAVAKIGTW